MLISTTVLIVIFLGGSLGEDDNISENIGLDISEMDGMPNVDDMPEVEDVPDVGDMPNIGNMPNIEDIPEENDTSNSTENSINEELANEIVNKLEETETKGEVSKKTSKFDTNSILNLLKNDPTFMQFVNEEYLKEVIKRHPGQNGPILPNRLPNMFYPWRPNHPRRTTKLGGPYPTPLTTKKDPITTEEYVTSTEETVTPTTNCHYVQDVNLEYELNYGTTTENPPTTTHEAEEEEAEECYADKDLEAELLLNAKSSTSAIN